MTLPYGNSAMIEQSPIQIETTYWRKPIPTNRFDWEAVTVDYDGPGSSIGHGLTEVQAIADLIDELKFKEIIPDEPGKIIPYEIVSRRCYHNPPSGEWLGPITSHPAGRRPNNRSS